MANDQAIGLRLRDPIDPQRDHVRGTLTDDAIEVVGYQDFLCPFCRSLFQTYKRLRATLGSVFS